MKQKNNKICKNKGFTLIEMIVVVALITTLTVIVLFNSTRLNSSILVSNTAYEIGLIVRESQVAGLGVKASKGANGQEEFSSSHGVHFNLQNPTQVILFADGGDKNGQYEEGEIIQEYTIQNKRSGTILSICAKSVTSTGYCVPTNGQIESLTAADVVFTRPNPEAMFKIQKIAGNGAPENHMGAIIINIGFPNDVCRSVTIEKTGAVRVDSAYCPPIQ